MSATPTTTGAVGDFAGWTINGAAPTSVLGLAGNTVRLRYSSVISGQSWAVPAGNTAALPGFITSAGSGIYTDS